ncbi:MAG: hypothetical protein ACI9XP_000454 [Lentimonas sp.]|jgi:hypothetical protein
MAKLVKFTGNMVSILMDLLLILIVIFFFAVRTSPVQTRLAKITASFLEGELKNEISIDKLDIVFFNRIALQNIRLTDNQNRPFAEIKALYATINALDIINGQFTLGAVTLDEGDFHLIREADTRKFNYQFLVDYFGRKKPKPKSKIQVELKSLVVENMDFTYDDFGALPKDFGVDWNHLHLYKLNLKAQNIRLDGKDLSAQINYLSAFEKSGFILNQFSSKVALLSDGIHFKNTQIHTPLSDIEIPKLNLLTSSMSNFSRFVDSVKFDAQLNKSRVSMVDISYFAPQLKGMNSTITVSSEVKNVVNKLKLTDLNLKIGNKTEIRGNVNLPDFKDIESAIFRERIEYAYIDFDDIEAIQLPTGSNTSTITLDKYTKRLGHIEGENLRLDGFYSQFVLAADELYSDIGSVNMKDGLMFTLQPDRETFRFDKPNNNQYDFVVNDFNLGYFLDNKEFNKVDGKFSISGYANSFKNIQFDSLSGQVNRFDFMGYSYSDIRVFEGSLVDNKLVAKVDIEDDNLNLIYDGYIDFKADQHFSFQVDLRRSLLDKLGITETKNTQLKSSFTVDLFGKNENDIKGKIRLNGLLYQEGDKKIEIPAMDLTVDRTNKLDKLSIKSELADLDIEGKVDFTAIARSLQNQLSQILPAIVKPSESARKKNALDNRFSYTLVVKDISDLLTIFAPDLTVSQGTKIEGSYNENTSDFFTTVYTPFTRYQNYAVNDLTLRQVAIGNKLSVDCHITKFDLNDSISADEVNFTAKGSKNLFESKLYWNETTLNGSTISWNTNILNEENFDFTLLPSHISIREKRWDIRNASQIDIRPNLISVKDFLFERSNQYIAINGLVSDDEKDKLRLKISHLQLEDFGQLLNTPIDLQGEVNGFAEISTPFKNIGFIGDANIKDLVINNEKVGTVFVQSEWAKNTPDIILRGDLNFRNVETFSFDGKYNLEKEKDNLDFDLIFDKTNIQFANAFMDPLVVSGIKGYLDGKVKIKGTPSKPELLGKIDLLNGNAKIELLGVNVRTNGKIKIDKYGFYLDYLPLTDEEGNAGSLTGSIYHDNFLNWNFDLAFNLEDDAVNKDPVFAWKPLPLKKFLLLNTQYKEGEYYYGKGYVTGFANISGYADNLEISTDLKTEKGTTLNFPMYGASEISEEESFLTFINKDTSIVIEEPKIDFTGVDLNLKFNVTTDAKLKIIFDEKLGDEISADGSGKIAMRLNNLGDLTLNGTYTVKEGVYNFAMGPVKQNFYIEDGGSISWTGDPYNANLNLKSYYKVNANLAEISSDQLNNQGTSNQDVFCYLNITESLIRPSIGFDIKAPRATESGKALVNRIVSDPEELNRQFFSLLLFKRFQPLKGSSTGGGGAALDLAANQINSVLSQFTQNYKMAVNLDANSVTGDKTFEFGVSKEFLDDRLVLSGSFGVENNTQSTTTTSQNYLIGDVNLEYLLNESGTFRVNIFNESNQNNVIQNNNQGLFKQGIGLHYQEDFNNYEDFKMLQYFFDMFRSKGNKKYPAKKKRTQTTVPPLNEEKSDTLPSPEPE